MHPLTASYCEMYNCRFEPDMLAFSGCYFGGGDKERYELGEIRKRWDTLPVRFLFVDSCLTLEHNICYIILL